MLRALIILIIMISSITACGIYQTARNSYAEAYSIKTGMTKDQVEDQIWARSTRNIETLTERNGSVVLVKWYRVDYDAQEPTPYLYKNNILIGWGFDFYAIYKAEMESGRHRRSIPSIGSSKDGIFSGTGSGFIINDNGDILTNYHVVEGAIRIKITKFSPLAAVVAYDVPNDLAVLKTNKKTGSFCSFSANSAGLLGQSIVVAGYPLPGILTPNMQITEGIVSGLSGIGNDSRYLQITAPAQAGNSGGPLLNRSGGIVGVVTAKLDAIHVAKSTGNLPENVNFSIKSSVVINFLRMNEIPFHFSDNELVKKKSTSEIAELAKKCTVKVENWQ